MQNVFQEIAIWADDLPYWEQAALDKVLSRTELVEADYEELLQYLLEDAQLVEKSKGRKLIDFQQGLNDEQNKCKPVLLKEISTLTNINALVAGQRLTFSPKLTAIYGRNGSGKSGYARVLGCAGFTRGDKTILPDVTKTVNGNTRMTADITVEDTCKEKTFTYQIGKSCVELSSFYVFDSTSVQVHMKGKNTFSFSPAGLSILVELTNVTDEVRRRLRTIISNKEQTIDFVKYFSGTSEITALVENLGINTSLTKLLSLATLSDQDKKRIFELDREIGNIGLDKTQEEIKQKEQQLTNIRNLLTWLKNVSSLLSDQALVDLNTQIQACQELDIKATQLSVEHFHHKRFSQTGSGLWNEFIRVAKQLAEVESKDHPYPLEGEPCLLCQQPLSIDAQKLIIHLWAYQAGEVKKDLEKAKVNLQAIQEKLKASTGFNLDDDLTSRFDAIDIIDASLASKLRKLADKYRQRGEKLNLAIINNQSIEIIPSLDKDDFEVVEKIILQLENDIAVRKSEDLENKRRLLEEERRKLEHRKRLAELLTDIKAYIEGLIWAREASKVIGNSRHITVKSNQIFTELVKNRYINIFEQTLKNLGRPIKVMISTSGSKGENLKQVVLKVHDTARNMTDPDKVLSEGEKRAVALADFLTEVALDTSSNGIILDDPVTSLDLEWRKTIARILANEASKRQVIIFTHDMPFLYLLLNFVDELQLEKQVHWVKRGDEDDLPGYVWLNTCPALESEYKKPTLAENYLKEATDEPNPQRQNRILKDGFGALRTTYEAFIVFEILNGVVLRFDERISFGRLEEICWDTNIVNEVVRTCERLSRYIEGHLHSDAMDSMSELTPKLLKEEVALFYDVRSRFRKLKNK